MATREINVDYCKIYSTSKKDTYSTIFKGEYGMKDVVINELKENEGKVCQ